jgi:hypothetical protein
MLLFSYGKKRKETGHGWYSERVVYRYARRWFHYLAFVRHLLVAKNISFDPGHDLVLVDGVDFLQWLKDEGRGGALVYVSKSVGTDMSVGGSFATITRTMFSVGFTHKSDAVLFQLCFG